MQISARTPASWQMHAVAMDYMSNGRLILGIGVSGLEVVEGWYGQPIPSLLPEPVNGFLSSVESSASGTRFFRRRALPATTQGWDRVRQIA